MISNGVEYFSPKVQDFIARNNDRLSFGISLDGCKPLHDMCRVFPDGLGSYDIAEAGCIHYKQNYNDKMLTKMTICPENLTWTFEAFKNLQQLNYPIIHANCVYEKGWTMNHGTILYDQLKKIADYILENDLENSIEFTMFDENYCRPQSLVDNKNYCGSTGCMLCCDPDGNIAPCVRFLKSSLGENVGDFTIGHIDTGLGKADIDKQHVEELDSITRQSQSPKECMECPISVGCGWCTAYNFQETGSTNKRCTYICWTHRARSLANVYYWNKVHIKNNEEERFRCYLSKEHALQLIPEEEYNMLLELADGKGEIPKDMLLDFVYSERPLGDFEEELKEYDRKNNQC
jgi:radical SAM peptide maturase (CXXX-repeat target family)